MSDHLLNKEYISANTNALKEAEKHKADIDKLRKQREEEHYKIHVEPYLKDPKSKPAKEPKKTKDSKPKESKVEAPIEETKKEINEKINENIAKVDDKLEEIAKQAETKSKAEPKIDMAGIQNIINKSK